MPAGRKQAKVCGRDVLTGTNLHRIIDITTNRGPIDNSAAVLI